MIFEATAANEYEQQWDHWLWTLHALFEPAVAHFKDAVETLTAKLKADRVILALSDEERWRPKVMPMYKSNRVKTRKPITYKPLRDWCHDVYETFQRPTLEGDDVLGILATHPKLVKGEKIVVSIDKDMKTIPGVHLNYAEARGSDDYEQFIRVIQRDEADYYHLFQTLTGDKTDGYPGCPGIGPVNAEKLLTSGGFEPVRAWQVVVAAYAKKGLGEEVALQNARVARICRHTDYDFTKKEVKLWQPPKAE